MRPVLQIKAVQNQKKKVQHLLLVDKQMYEYNCVDDHTRYRVSCSSR